MLATELAECPRLQIKNATKTAQFAPRIYAEAMRGSNRAQQTKTGSLVLSGVDPGKIVAHRKMV
jgi:hypothetical protein